MPPKKQKTLQDTGDRCKGLFYSDPNAGKTHLLGTAGFDERLAPMFLLDFEGGTKSLDGMPGFHKLEGIGDSFPSDATVVAARCHDWEDFNTAFERIRVNDDNFKSTGLDSTSEVHNFAIENILMEEGDRRGDPDSVQQQDYGKALIQLRRLVREFRDLPLHFFCTAHAKEITHPQRGMITVPNLYGKGAFEIPGLLETVGYVAVLQADAAYAEEFGLSEGDEYRSLLLRNYPKLNLKVRTAWGIVAPEEIEPNPTMTQLLDALGYQF